MADDSLDIDVLASSLESDYSDVAMLLRVLADRLSGALGNRLRIERDGGRFRKPLRIRSLSVVLGDDELTASLEDGRLDTSISHRSGGIRIRSEKLALTDWLRRLLESLRAEATYNQATRAALESIVIGGQDAS